MALREKRLAISHLYGLRRPLLVHHCSLTGMSVCVTGWLECRRDKMHPCLPRKGDGIAGLVRPRGGLTSLSSGLTSEGNRNMVSPHLLCPHNSQAKVWWPQEELPGAHAMTKNSCKPHAQSDPGPTANTGRAGLLVGLGSGKCPRVSRPVTCKEQIC